MCEKGVEEKSYNLECVPDYFKTKEMCNDAVEKDPYNLDYVSDYFKMKKMCEGVVEKYPWAVEYVQICSNIFEYAWICSWLVCDMRSIKLKAWLPLPL